MFLKQFLVSAIGLISLILWYSSYQISCFSLIIPILIGILLSKASFEYANARKRCLANCYFNHNSILHKLLTKKVFITIVSILNGIILSTILMLNVIIFNLSDFIILTLDMFFILLVYNFMEKTQFLQNNVKYPILKNSVSFFSSAIFMIIFLIINTYQTPPSYIQNDLVQTIHIASNQIYSNCDFIDLISRVSNEIVAIKWWIMIKVTIETNNMYLKYIMWGIYLMGSYLMLFAFARVITEILHIIKAFL